jgi:hypothetical protein
MAISVRGAIIEILRADSELVDMLPDDEHIYHRTAPQDADAPFVILHKQAGTPEYSFADYHDSEIYTVKGVDRGGDSLTADALDERIRTLLHDAELDIEGYGTLYCRRESDVDYGEVEEGAIIHHVGAQYRILKQPIP